MSKVSLNELYEVIEMYGSGFEDEEGYRAYINKENGEVLTVSKRFMTIAENGEEPEEMEEWEEEDFKMAKDIVENEDDYVDCPDENYINEIDMMKDFAYERKEGNEKDLLLNCIIRDGAHRKFKDKIYSLNIQDEWYDYKDKAVIEKLKEWCEENKLSYEE